MDTRRGFTDHEHLDEAEIIQMNGRVYDYNVGRFMSVDPVIQSPENSQSINPYSYIMNNPLSGVDPTGYVSCEPNCVGTGSRIKQAKNQQAETAVAADNASNKVAADAHNAVHGHSDNGAQKSSFEGAQQQQLKGNMDKMAQSETNAGQEEGSDVNQEQSFSSNVTKTRIDDEGNPVTPVNLGVAVGGVAAGIADVNGADILKPKQNVTQHKNPVLNKPRIGIAKNADEILVNITDAGKTASKVLAVAGIAVTTTEAIVDIRNPNLSQDQKIGSGIKAATDVGVILASGAIGGPVGLGLAASYLAADYIFDFKSGIQEGVKYYRCEEENQ